MAPMLTTDRLTLAGHRATDLDSLAAMWAEPAVYTMIGGKPRAREDVWIRLLRSIGQWTLFGYGSWVLHDTASGRLVGEIGLMDARRSIVPSIDGMPEVGWTLAPWAHGRGYAREGLEAVLGWTDAHGIATTTCIIDPGNAASLRLAGRVGYGVRTQGVYHDKTVHILERAAG